MCSSVSSGLVLENDTIRELTPVFHLALCFRVSSFLTSPLRWLRFLVTFVWIHLHNASCGRSGVLRVRTTKVYGVRFDRKYTHVLCLVVCLPCCNKAGACLGFSGCCVQPRKRGCGEADSRDWKVGGLIRLRRRQELFVFFIIYCSNLLETLK